MAHSPKEVAQLAKEEKPPEETFEERIDRHLVDRTRDTGVVGCSWGIPYGTHSDDPSILGVIQKFLEKGWFIKIGTASDGEHMDIMEDPKKFNMNCSNIRVYDPRKEDPMADPAIWDSDKKEWKEKECARG